MALTYVRLATQTLTGTASSVIFSGISQSYTDLALTMMTRADTATTQQDTYLRVNGLTTNIYGERYIFSNNGTSVSNGSASGRSFIYIGAIAGANTVSNLFSSHTIYLPSYTWGNHKTISWEMANENNTTASWYSIGTGNANTTNAISSITVLPASGNFVANSTFTLYGIINA